MCDEIYSKLYMWDRMNGIVNSPKLSKREKNPINNDHNWIAMSAADISSKNIDKKVFHILKPKSFFAAHKGYAQPSELLTRNARGGCSGHLIYQRYLQAHLIFIADSLKISS